MSVQEEVLYIWISLHFPSIMFIFITKSVLQTCILGHIQDLKGVNYLKV